MSIHQSISHNLKAKSKNFCFSGSSYIMGRVSQPLMTNLNIKNSGFSEKFRCDYGHKNCDPNVLSRFLKKIELGLLTLNIRLLVFLTIEITRKVPQVDCRENLKLVQ